MEAFSPRRMLFWKAPLQEGEVESKMSHVGG